MAVQRSERIRCHLPCEIVGRRRKRIPATVVGLSDKGLSLESDLQIEQGDGLHLCLLPHRKQRAVEIHAIAWSERQRYDRSSGNTQRVIGFLISDPTDAYTALVEEVRRRDQFHQSLRPPQRPRRPPILVEREAHTDPGLPRPRAPMPPPKPEDEENLPQFRVRMKQSGGPRSRSRTVRAHSVQEAERRAVGDLAGEWEILEVKRLA